MEYNRLYRMLRISWFVKGVVFFVCVQSICAFSEVGNLTCPLSHDFCGWETNTETMSPQTFDEGWTMYSPHLDGELTHKVDHFAVAKSQDNMRTFLTTNQYIPSSSWLSLTFRYTVTGASSITIYTLQDKAYRLLWSSPVNVDLLNTPTDSTFEINNSTNFNTTEKPTGIETDIAWRTETITSLCRAFALTKPLQICFIAYIEPDDFVALADIKTLVLTEEPPECIKEDEQWPFPNNTESGAAWKFFIIFSLLFCFGAVFLAAMLIIGRGTKQILIPKTVNSERSQRIENPSYGFRYDILEESEA